MTKELETVIKQKEKVLKKIRRLNAWIEKIETKKAPLWEKHRQLVATEKGLRGAKNNGNTNSING